MSKTGKTWKPTRYQNLYRHASDVYYARLTVNGKKTWRSLKINLLEVAGTELAELLKTARSRTELDTPKKAAKTGTCTLGQMANQAHYSW